MNTGNAADGLLVQEMNVDCCLQFFSTLFPRQINGNRCFPVLQDMDTGVLWLKTSYTPDYNSGNKWLSIWYSDGSIRQPSESQFMALSSAIRKDRIIMAYWFGTRITGHMLKEVYTGLPLTDIVITAPEKQPFLSILMPVYNREDTVNRAIRSIKASSFTDFECIIIDDGSTDNTGAVIDESIKNDDRFVKLTLDSNCGIGYALAVGTLNSFGKWLTRCDSDDEYTIGHLQSRVAYIAANHNVTVIYGGMSPVNGESTIPLKNGISVPVFNTAQGPTIFFKRDVIDRIGTFSYVRYGEDEDFLNRAIQCGENISKIDDKSYIYYRDSSNSLTKNYIPPYTA